MRRIVRLLVIVGMLLGALVMAMPVGAAYHNEWLQYEHPKYSQIQIAWIALCNDATCASPRVGVPVHAAWMIQGGSYGQDWQTGNDGRAGLQLANMVLPASNVGDSIRVDISFVNSAGIWQDSTSLSYTIDPDNAVTAPAVNSYDPAPYSPPAYSPPPQSGGPVSGSNFVCPAGYPIKANDNSGIYHIPGGQFYDATNAYNCFATEGAAQAAGYRKSLR